MSLLAVTFIVHACLFFFSSRRRHTRCLSDWSSDVCSSDLGAPLYVCHPLRTPDREWHTYNGAPARIDGVALFQTRGDGRPRILGTLPASDLRRRDDSP